MRRAVAIGALVVAAGACSGGSSGKSAASSTTTTVAPTVARDAACTRLTIADATALFGEPAVTVTATQRRASTASSSCFYGTSGASGQLLQFRIYSSEGFYARSQHPDAQDVPGLGEQAFLSKAGPGGIVDCQFVKQGNVYALSYSNSTGNAATKADALVALARAVAGRA